MTDTTTIIRAPHDKDHPYVVVAKDAAEDERLSLEARGALLYFLVKPDDWEINADDLAKRGGCGRQRAYRILKELELAGYIVRTPLRDAQGRMAGTSATLHEQSLPVDADQAAQPCDENPYTDNPDTENPYTEKPRTENHHHSKYRVQPSNHPNQVSTTTTTSQDQPVPPKPAAPGGGGLSPGEREASAYLQDVCGVKAPSTRRSLIAAGWTLDTLRREWAAFAADNARRHARGQQQLGGGAFALSLADKDPRAAPAPPPEKPADPMADIGAWRAMTVDEQNAAYRRYQRERAAWKAQQPQMAA
jgi:hypothetical protein